MNTDKMLPLEGIKVVELATVVAAPTAGRMLCAYGAEVIKVENLIGDDLRRAGEFERVVCEDYKNPIFTIQNSGKKLVALNLKSEEGKRAMLKLLEDADVFLSNVRAASLARLGLDYEAEGPVARDEKHPNTDMILYVRLDGNAHSMTMLQIPRDVFVGEAGGAAGKINGILAKNVDIGDGNGLGAVKTYIETNFGLPIDDYVTIDMDALTEMVDAFGGVEVYVPQNMRYYNEKTGALEGELLQGWRTLLGGDCEFFLRYRQGLPRSDLDRLVMQRQFYAGLFRRLKTASVGDIVKLLPVAQKYIKTDISTLELMSIAIEVSGMDSADISIGRLPVYGSGQLYAGEHSVVVTAKEETAALLNEYFRPADDPIAAADIGTPEWPTTGGAAGAEMSTMGDVEAVGAEEPRK